MAQIKENYLYTKDHEWVLTENNVAKIGISDFAQSSLGDIVFVELPEINTELEAGDSFGVVESIKSVSDLYTPITGKVVDRNTSLEDTPEEINASPFDSWLIKVEFSNSEELESLMKSSDYKKFCDES